MDLNIFKEFLKESGKNQSDIAKSLSISATQLSQILSGKYPIESQANDVLTKLQKLMDNYSKDTESSQKFVETYDVMVSRVVVKKTVKNRSIGMLWGIAGSGKTTAVKKIAEEYPNSVVIECFASIDLKEFLSQINTNAKLGLKLRGTVGTQFTQVANSLKRVDKVLFFDEVEYLKVRGLEMIRRINDFTNNPVVISGTETLYDNLHGKGRNQPETTHRQLYSRVRHQWELLSKESNLQNSKTLRQLVESFGIVPTDGLLKKICQLTAGVPRDIASICRELESDWGANPSVKELEQTMLLMKSDTNMVKRCSI